LKNIFYWLSGSPEKDTGWNPVDKNRNMFRLSPVNIPEWITAAYLDKVVYWFEKNGFQSGINHYRAMQTTFDETLALKGKKITQPSIYIWGKEEGLCQYFHPEAPKLEVLQSVHPGLRKQVGIDHVGHWPHQEAANVVNNEILQFLDEINY